MPRRSSDQARDYILYAWKNPQGFASACSLDERYPGRPARRRSSITSEQNDAFTNVRIDATTIGGVSRDPPPVRLGRRATPPARTPSGSSSWSRRTRRRGAGTSGSANRTATTSWTTRTRRCCSRCSRSATPRRPRSSSRSGSSTGCRRPPESSSLTDCRARLLRARHLRIRSGSSVPVTPSDLGHFGPLAVSMGHGERALRDRRGPVLGRCGRGQRGRGRVRPDRPGPPRRHGAGVPRRVRRRRARPGRDAGRLADRLAPAPHAARPGQAPALARQHRGQRGRKLVRRRHLDRVVELEVADVGSDRDDPASRAADTDLLDRDQGTARRRSRAPRAAVRGRVRRERDRAGARDSRRRASDPVSPGSSSGCGRRSAMPDTGFETRISRVLGAYADDAVVPIDASRIALAARAAAPGDSRVACARSPRSARPPRSASSSSRPRSSRRSSSERGSSAAASGPNRDSSTRSPRRPRPDVAPSGPTAS